MNGDFWCEKCGEPLSVCNGTQWCSEGRRRGIDLYFAMMAIEKDRMILDAAFDMSVAYNGAMGDVLKIYNAFTSLCYFERRIEK